MGKEQLEDLKEMSEEKLRALLMEAETNKDLSFKS
jgi:hypothetical protein